MKNMRSEHLSNAPNDLLRPAVRRDSHGRFGVLDPAGLFESLVVGGGGTAAQEQCSTTHDGELQMYKVLVDGMGKWTTVVGMVFGGGVVSTNKKGVLWERDKAEHNNRTRCQEQQQHGRRLE